MRSNEVFLNPSLSATGPWDHILPENLLAQRLIPNPIPIGSDLYWMTEAWSESLKNHGLTPPNPAVGCVIVDAKGKEISRGITQPFPSSHAEKIALDQISDPKLLHGATAYVTLEPCAHTGKNPPCADLLAKSPVRRVVISRLDPNPLVAGKGIEKLRQAGKQVEIGLLFNEISAWNLPFFTQQTLKRPLVALKWAQTLDGQLADDTMQSKWISSKTSRTYSHWLRQHYDLLIVGAGTVIADHPRLDIREGIYPKHGQPLPIIFDPKGLIFQQPIKCQELLKKSTFHEGRDVVLITTKKALDTHSTSWIHSLKNVAILVQPGKELVREFFNLTQGAEVSKVLGRPIQSMMIEGGSQTLALWLQAGYGDIFHSFVAPILTGGNKNRVFVQTPLEKAQRLHTLASSQLESDVLMEMITPEIRDRIFTKT